MNGLLVETGFINKNATQPTVAETWKVNDRLNFEDINEGNMVRTCSTSTKILSTHVPEEDILD